MFRKWLVLAGLLMATPAAFADWSQFRGPNGSSVSDSVVPVSWTPSDNVAWKVKLPGAGVSSPIVVGNKLIVTCYSGYGLDRQNPGEIKNLMRHVLCYDATSGKMLWQADVEAAQPEDPYSGAGVPAHGTETEKPIQATGRHQGNNDNGPAGDDGIGKWCLDIRCIWVKLGIYCL